MKLTYIPLINLQEHRSQPRLNVSSLITIKSPSTDEEWQENLSNISWGGVRIRTKKPLGENGDLLKLLLRILMAEILKYFQALYFHGNLVECIIHRFVLLYYTIRMNLD